MCNQERLERDSEHKSQGPFIIIIFFALFLCPSLFTAAVQATTFLVAELFNHEKCISWKLKISSPSLSVQIMIWTSYLYRDIIPAVIRLLQIFDRPISYLTRETCNSWRRIYMTNYVFIYFQVMKLLIKFSMKMFFSNIYLSLNL